MWTGHTRKAESRSMLPPYLSWPVLCLAPIVFTFALSSGVMYPIPSLLTVVPAIIVLAAIWWLDRVEPEPLEAKVHALLWGATVATTIAGTVNTLVAFLLGERAALVISAPLGEEILKGLGVLWVMRQGKIRTTLDGVVYAGLVAGGFALTENIQYFVMGAESGQLWGVFVGRGLLTPFAHPLFTLWIGVSLGLAARKRRGFKLYDLWGLPLAIGLHSLWNGMSVWGAEQGSSNAIGMPIVVIVLFIAIFLGCTTVLVVVRVKTARRYSRLIGPVALHYHLDPREYEMFRSWKSVRNTRKTIPWRKRRSFDALHSSVIRLMEHHDAGHGYGDAGDLVNSLNEARRVAGNRAVQH